MMHLFSKNYFPENICEIIAKQTEKYSGSDLKSVSKELIMKKIREHSKKSNSKINLKNVLKNISESEINEVISRVNPSPCCELKMYSVWSEKFGSI